MRLRGFLHMFVVAIFISFGFVSTINAADTDGDGLDDAFEQAYAPSDFNCIDTGNCAVLTGCVEGGTASGNHYLFCGDTVEWGDAREFCQSYGGDLVLINDASEDSYIKANLPSADRNWIGFTDQDNEGKFYWVRSIKSSFTNWGTFQPSGGVAEDCVNYDDDFLTKWDDVRCTSDSAFICEDGFGLDPTEADTDMDGLNDGDEVNVHFTNPYREDTDGDGVSDSYEVAVGTDPLDPASFPGFAPGDEVMITQTTGWAITPSMVWTGSEFGVDWEDARSGTREIFLARLTAAGAKIGSDYLVTAGSNGSYSPSLAWSGSEFAAAYEDIRNANYETYFSRMTSAGVKIGSDVRMSSDPDSSFASVIAWSGSEFGVSWHDNRPGNFEIYFARMSAAGVKVGSDVRLTFSSVESRDPSIVWTGSEFGISYTRTSTQWDIYFVRVSVAGAKIGGDSPLANGTQSAGSSSLAWTGSEFGGMLE